MSLCIMEEWLKGRLDVRIVRHSDNLCGLHVVRSEVEVGVAIGLDEASLPSWHGSRRKAEVISGSETTVSQSLETDGTLHRGNRTCNKAKGPGWRLGRRKLSKLSRLGGSGPGEALVTVTSHSRPCATPNKEAASLKQDVSCSTSVI